LRIQASVLSFILMQEPYSSLVRSGETKHSKFSLIQPVRIANEGSDHYRDSKRSAWPYKNLLLAYIRSVNHQDL